MITLNQWKIVLFPFCIVALCMVEVARTCDTDALKVCSEKLDDIQEDQMLTQSVKDNNCRIYKDFRSCVDPLKEACTIKDNVYLETVYRGGPNAVSCFNIGASEMNQQMKCVINHFNGIQPCMNFNLSANTDNAHFCPKLKKADDCIQKAITPQCGQEAAILFKITNTYPKLSDGQKYYYCPQVIDPFNATYSFEPSKSPLFKPSSVVIALICLPMTFLL